MQKKLSEHKEKTMGNVAKLLRFYATVGTEIPKEIIELINFNENLVIETRLNDSSKHGMPYTINETTGINLVRTLEKKYYAPLVKASWVFDDSKNDGSTLTGVLTNLLINDDYETLGRLHEEIFNEVINKNDMTTDIKYIREYLGFVLDLDRMDQILNLSLTVKNNKKFFDFFKDAIGKADYIYKKQKQRYLPKESSTKENWASNWFGQIEKIKAFIGKDRVDYADIVLTKPGMYVFFEDAFSQNKDGYLATTEALKKALSCQNKKVIDFYINNNVFSNEWMLVQINAQIDKRFNKLKNLFNDHFAGWNGLDVKFFSNYLNRLSGQSAVLDTRILCCNLYLYNNPQVITSNAIEFLNSEIEHGSQKSPKLTIKDLIAGGRLFDEYLKSFSMKMQEIDSGNSINKIIKNAKYENFFYTLYEKLECAVKLMPIEMQNEINKEVGDSSISEYFLNKCIKCEEKPFSRIMVVDSMGKDKLVLGAEHERYIISFLQSRMLTDRLQKKESGTKKNKI